jgi:hypothetical protein
MGTLHILDSINGTESAHFQQVTNHTKDHGCVWAATAWLKRLCNSCCQLIVPTLQHEERITGVSLDAKGDFVASCSDDGKVLPRGMTAKAIPAV